MKHRRLFFALGLGAALGAAAALSLAEPSRAKAPAAPAPPKGGFAPDPPGNASKKQWVFDISIHGGKASLPRVSSVLVDTPTPTLRMMGRFAVEFWVGKELLDRIRFDVPMLDRDPKNRRRDPLRGPDFTNVSTRLKVRMADSPRTAFVALVDRATGDVQRFAWPPDAEGKLAPLGAPAAPAQAKETTSDAGSPGDSGSFGDAGPGDAAADGR
ncbi:hypothetical protein [Polyangium mundeleinium]|uniref:Uncharacterized protein n=1 Tax=Polyangium mundeleinium TaxID=2995306 RepID=A0ABT5F8B7_9BACT|nr:hypothetical protein [Polyangium mundeleinium]MDC0749849.1 hypothetical protein [Polyangium mundeleinium]